MTFSRLRNAAFLLGVSVVVIITGGFAWLCLVRWDNTREWRQLRQELTAKGEILTAVGRQPRVVADPDNFYGDPLWREWMPGTDIPIDQRRLRVLSQPVNLDSLRRKMPDIALPEEAANLADLFRKMMALNDEASGVPGASGTVKAARAFLEAVQPTNEILDRVQQLAGRPDAVFPLRYDAGLGMPLPFLDPVLQCGKLFSARAQARAMTGDTDGAVNDTLTLLRLGQLMQNDTMLIGQLVASSMVSLATETARNCLPNASFDQLQRMQTAFENVDLITGLGNAMRLERALCNDSLDRQNWAFYKVPHSDSGHMETAYVNLMTWPWLPANQSAYNRYVQAWIEALKKDSPPLLVSKAAVVEAMPKMNGAESRLALFLSTRASFDGSVRVVAKRQIEANQAVIACAIQRFYLKKHVLPETLSELIPELRLDLPRDVTSGEAFRYVRESETTYKLWSPGWNGVDDGGVLPAKRSDLESGDWVWQGRVK